MTGHIEHNFPAFRKAAKELRAAGYRVISPAELNEGMTATWEDYLRRDVAALTMCDTVAVLPGWELSKGAQLECYVARALGMPIKRVEELLSLEVAA